MTKKKNVINICGVDINLTDLDALETPSDEALKIIPPDDAEVWICTRAYRDIVKIGEVITVFSPQENIRRKGIYALSPHHRTYYFDHRNQRFLIQPKNLESHFRRFA